LASYLLCIISN